MWSKQITHVKLPGSVFIQSLTIASAMLVATSTVHAGPYGYDLHNNLAPASQAMAGASHARPQDTVSAVFGNPATLTQFTGTQFTFGGTFYMPEVTLEHDGSGTGAGYFKADSGTDIFPVPQIAVTQDLRGLGLPATLGLGVTAVSGIGSEFRGTPASLGAGAEFIIFGINIGAGYELTDTVSLGAAATVSFAQLDLGLASIGAETHDLGMRGTLGLTWDVTPATTLGVFYQSELQHNYDNIIQTGITPTGLPIYGSQEIDQPANVGIGIANNSLMGGNLLLMADVMYKYWEDGEFWQDLYENQFVFMSGAQYTHGKWKYRIGYGYAEDPTNDKATAPIGNLTTVFGGIGSPVAVPLAGATLDFLQASQTEVIYEHRIGLGVGYEGFLMPNLNIDLGGGWEFEEDRCYGKDVGGALSCGGNTRAEVYSWHVGFGATWKF